MNSCVVCNRKTNGAYCDNHEIAYESLRQRYEAWKQAMDITWERYLSEVRENPNTGVWVKEVASKLLEEG